jgi:hypothetical protein
MAVWASLSSPVHLEHYADDGLGEDWSAMRRVVAALSAREYAATLFAFTSLDLFCITFSPAYGEWGGSGTVVLAFDSRRRLFDVKYEGFDKQDRARYRCEELEVVRLVDALVLRMSLTRRDPTDRVRRRT